MERKKKAKARSKEQEARSKEQGEVLGDGSRPGEIA
jgi:hypothetical protein